MEQRFYKIRLVTGRVIGPIELDRIKLFISKDKITGLEMARLYPAGEWKDINTFPEIAELLMQRLEGKLTFRPDTSTTSTGAVTKTAKQADTTDKGPGSISLDVPQNEPEVPSLMSSTATAKADPPPVPEPKHEETASDREATVIMSADDERTKLVSDVDVSKPSMRNAPASGGAAVELVQPERVEPDAIPSAVSREQTAMLSLPGGATEKGKKRVPIKRKLVLGAIIALAALALLIPETQKRTGSDAPFVIEMPSPLPADPQKAEELYLKGLGLYAQDTAEGYKQAARFFLKAASLDSNNVKALCFLASSYMNLIDVVNRDDAYFSAITRLIELERAKGVDLPETVIADVELYHILGNPDAAIDRINNYLNSHQWDAVMLYYLAMSFYLKGQYPEATNYLAGIDPKDYFSPKINYLQGLIHEKNGKTDEAVAAYRETLARSPRHLAARAKLVELLFRKDDMRESGLQADYIINYKNHASAEQLAQAYYHRARIKLMSSRENDALTDLELALKKKPEDPDILLELYTVKAKLGAKVKDASEMAKMFHFLALGEKRLRDGELDAALSDFLSAREAQYDDPTPLLRMAEVFRRKGDLQSAKVNLEKAVKASPRRPDLYPKYIQTLIEAYEFEEAKKAVATFTELYPSPGLVDKLMGEMYLKQDKPREALVYFKRAIGSASVDSSVYNAYASLMMKANNFRDAAFFYGLAQRFDPLNVEATIGIGRAFAELEGLEKGIGYVQNALQLSPKKAALLSGLADIYNQKGDYAAALKLSENASAADPKYALAHKARGDALAGQDKIREALDAYFSYAKLAPLDPAGRVERYKLFLRKPDLRAAKQEIQEVLEAYPKYPGAYCMLGEIYRIAGDSASAVKAAEEEIKNNPSYVPAYVLAGTAYNVAKDFPKALETLSKALAFNPDDVSALMQAATANQALKTYPAAQTMLERAVALDPGNPQVHKRLAALFQELGNQEKMREHIRAYLDLFPDAPDRAEMKRLLGR